MARASRAPLRRAVRQLLPNVRRTPRQAANAKTKETDNASDDDSEIGGQTPEGYDGMLAVVGEELAQAPGFIMHTSHPTDDGWRVIEVWESKDHSARFFAAHIAPKLPDGIRPKLTFMPLHSLLQPEFFLLIWSLVSFWAVAQIWYAQNVIYPLFAKVGENEYAGYHRFYIGNILLPVILRDSPVSCYRLRSPSSDQPCRPG